MRVSPKPTTTPKGAPCSDHENDAKNRELVEFGLHYLLNWRQLSKEVMARNGIFEVSGPPTPTPISRHSMSSVVVPKDVDMDELEYWAYFDDEWVRLDAW